MVVFDRYREKFLNLFLNRVWFFGERVIKNIIDNICKMYICVCENFINVGGFFDMKI